MEMSLRILMKQIFRSVFAILSSNYNGAFLGKQLMSLVNAAELHHLGCVSDIFSEAAVQRCSVRKVFLEISQNSEQNICARVSFLIKLQTSGLQLH